VQASSDDLGVSGDLQLVEVRQAIRIVTGSPPHASVDAAASIAHKSAFDEGASGEKGGRGAQVYGEDAGPFIDYALRPASDPLPIDVEVRCLALRC